MITGDFLFVDKLVSSLLFLVFKFGPKSLVRYTTRFVTCQVWTRCPQAVVPNTYHSKAKFGVGYTSLVKEAGSCLIIVLGV